MKIWVQVKKKDSLIPQIQLETSSPGKEHTIVFQPYLHVTDFTVQFPFFS